MKTWFSRDEVRVERWGKSPPGDGRLLTAVNSIRSNTVGGHKGLPGCPQEVAGARRQRRAKIDGCQIQNPAYSFAHGI